MDSPAFGNCMVIINKLSKPFAIIAIACEIKIKSEQLKVVLATMTLFRNYLKFCPFTNYLNVNTYSEGNVICKWAKF